MIAAIAAVAEHSIACQFASSRPDVQDAEQLCAFAKQIQSKLSARSTLEPKITGNHPYEVELVPKPNKDCIKCGYMCCEVPCSSYR